MLLSEIEELKHLMDVKNEEIESLISQNQKQKNAYDLDLDYLRFENEELKKQFLNNE